MEIKLKLVKHLSPIPPPYGGVTIHVLRLIEKLQHDGFSAGAYFNSGSKFLLKHLSKYKGFSRKLFFYSIYNLLNDTKNYQIIHTHNFFDDAVLLYFLNFFYKKKIVVTVHNDRSYNIYNSQNIIFRFFIKKLSKKNITWITVSEIAKKELLRLPINIHKINVIPAFIPKLNESTSKVNISNELIKFTKKFDQVIIFYAFSLLVDNKDLYGAKEVLLMFAKLLKNKKNNYCLVFCVSKINSDISSYKSFAKENDIFDKIYWQLGPIKDMYELWSMSDLYVRPTMLDGDSISIREALEMNVKVVASDVAKRPNGVLTYKKENISDFKNKVLIKLKEKKSDTSNNKDFSHYNKILKLYLKLKNEK